MVEPEGEYNDDSFQYTTLSQLHSLRRRTNDTDTIQNKLTSEDTCGVRIFEEHNQVFKAGLYILLFSPYNLPNFLTKFPTEPEVNLSCRRLRLLH